MTKNRKTIVLQITENCNLNCLYCYQHTKTLKVTDIDTLKNIIKDSFQQFPEYDELEFDFIGGEPLLFPDIIQEICEWTWAQNFKKPHIFFVTTNGTLLKPNFKSWVEKHKQEIWLGLSIDGTKEMHDKNRCNSFDKIDVDFFLRCWPIQFVKMTVSPLTLPDMAKGVIYLHKLGFNVTCNLAYGIDWGQAKNEEILEEQLKILADYYLENKHIVPIPLLELPLFKLGQTQIESYCGTGTGMAAYDINGKAYPCQMFYNTSMDKNTSLKSYDFDTLHLNYYHNCAHKVMFNICPLCVGMNLIENNTDYLCDKNICNLMQVHFRANAYFQTKKILQKDYQDKNPERIKLSIKGIKAINDYYNS
ncbi:MAG: radical SAM protein [Paludibacteraceae bacterium]